MALRDEARDLFTPLLADMPNRSHPSGAVRRTGSAPHGDALRSLTPARLLTPGMRTPGMRSPFGGSARPRRGNIRSAVTLHESLDFEPCLNNIAASETHRPMRCGDCKYMHMKLHCHRSFPRYFARLIL